MDPGTPGAIGRTPKKATPPSTNSGGSRRAPIGPPGSAWPSGTPPWARAAGASDRLSASVMIAADKAFSALFTLYLLSCTIDYLARAGDSVEEAISPSSAVRFLIREMKLRARATPATSSGRWNKRSM